MAWVAPKSDGVRGGRLGADFRRLWVSQVLSQSASQASYVAALLFVLDTTRSPVSTGLVGSASIGSYVLGQLPAGVIVDRVDRRTVMIMCEGLGGIAAGTVAVLLILGQLGLWELLLAVIAQGVAGAGYNLAEVAALERVIGPNNLAFGLTLNQARFYAAGIVGPALGGALYGVAHVLPFAIDFSSYAVSALLILQITTALTVVEGASQGPGHAVALRARVAWAWHIPLVRIATMSAAGSNFIINSAALAFLVLASQNGLPPALIGAILAGGGVGGVLGAVLASRLQAHLPPLDVFAVMVPLSAGAVLLLAAVLPGLTLPVLYALLLAPWPMWQGLVTARWLALVQDAERGSVLATVTAVGSAPSSGASVFTGWVAGLVGAGGAVAVLGAGMWILAVLALLPGVRRCFTGVVAVGDLPSVTREAK